jgi:hypothetical protein
MSRKQFNPLQLTPAMYRADALQWFKQYIEPSCATEHSVKLDIINVIAPEPVMKSVPIVML